MDCGGAGLNYRSAFDAAEVSNQAPADLLAGAFVAALAVLACGTCNCAVSPVGLLRVTRTSWICRLNAENWVAVPVPLPGFPWGSVPFNPVKEMESSVNWKLGEVGAGCGAAAVARAVF